nr:uncharacterized protein LOC112277592 [Physcomitrium patens]|eukprot:XP_024365883.1 uncharacterized protein LOC112277592 [Physcomitrella patens]
MVKSKIHEALLRPEKAPSPRIEIKLQSKAKTYENLFFEDSSISLINIQATQHSSPNPILNSKQLSENKLNFHKKKICNYEFKLIPNKVITLIPSHESCIHTQNENNICKKKLKTEDHFFETNLPPTHKSINHFSIARNVYLPIKNPDYDHFNTPHHQNFPQNIATSFKTSSPFISSNYGVSSPISPREDDSSPNVFDLSCQKSPLQDHVHSPKCAKNEYPPCPNQQFQPQFENFDGFGQNNFIDKCTYPSLPNPSQWKQTSGSSEFTSYLDSHLHCSIPLLDSHNCCCGKCKPNGESITKIQSKCFYCKRIHTCCCGMCSCPNPNCVKSPNNHHVYAQPILSSRQEESFMNQLKQPTRPKQLYLPSHQKKKFKDHYIDCCKFQDSFSKGKSCLHNYKDFKELKFFYT